MEVIKVWRHVSCRVVLPKHNDDTCMSVDPN